MGDLGDEPEDHDADDDEMPELEDEEADGEENNGKGKAAGEPAKSSKIEEVP